MIERRKPVHLSLRIDLLQRAEERGLDLSNIVEHAIERAVIKAEHACTPVENDDAIDAYNAFIEQYGLFTELRGFSEDNDLLDDVNAVLGKCTGS